MLQIYCGSGFPAKKQCFYYKPIVLVIRVKNAETNFYCTHTLVNNVLKLYGLSEVNL